MTVAIERRQIDIPSSTFDGQPLTLRAVRLVNRDKQPVILWEGFYQNGAFFELEEAQASIAEYLHRLDYDVWIIDSRGNGGSTGKGYPTSMDDFAANDIPAVISFVAGETGRKPI